MKTKRSSRIISIFLALIFIASMALSAYADSNTLGSSFDEEAFITEELKINKNDNSPNDIIEINEDFIGNYGNIVINANPDQPVGSTKTITVSVSNETMGIPSLAGQGLSIAARRKAAKKAAKVIVSKLGTSLLAGLDVASFILACAAMKNAKSGNNGIKIKTYFKYKKVYNNNEGHYIYGWDIIKVTVSPY